MNNNQTIDKLNQMRLTAMASLHQRHLHDNTIESMTADEYLALLTDHQWEERLNRKIERLIKQALGYQACLTEHKTLYTNTAKLIGRLKLTKMDGTYLRELAKIRKTELLILDDFGLHAFDNQSREILLDIIDERHDQSSTILSSQIPVAAWYDLIGEQTIADAILDRIVNSSHRISLKGESLRKGKLMQINKND